MRSLHAIWPFWAALAAGLVWEDGTGKLPAMGWNSWDTYECNISATLFVTQAQAMLDLGLLESGYEYVNLDDCWSLITGRDTVTNQLVPDPVKFPDGISGLADQIHGMGFKIGIYSSAGTETCAGYPASIGFESTDAASWAAWGVDYLKYDNCYVPEDWVDACEACTPEIGRPGLYHNGTCPEENSICASGYDYTASRSAERYRIMGDALAAQNRTIQFNICVWGYAGVEQWGNQTGNSWRISTDIEGRWAYITSILNINSFKLNAVNFWGHNDADMLEVGNPELTFEETRSHFAFWAAMKSPLILGADLTSLAKEHMDVLKNEYLVAFNQDNLHGAPATPYKWGLFPDWTWNETYPAQYWAGQSQQGTFVLMLNTHVDAKFMTVDFGEVPYLQANGTYHILDAWTGDCLGQFTNSATVRVESHDTAVLVFQFCGKFLSR